jgi:acetyl-CoA C-acetyltransferase
MDDIVIVSAVRTAVGSFNGALSSVHAHDLGAIALREAFSRGGIEAADVDEVIFGQVLAAGDG